MSLFDNVLNSAVKQQAKSVVGQIGGQVSAGSFPSVSTPDLANLGSTLARQLLPGLKLPDIVNSAILGNLFNPLANVPIELVGGVTLKRARELHQLSAATNFAKKNLFFISVADVLQKDAATGAQRVGSFLPGSQPRAAFNLNLFATAVAYPGTTISGDAVRVGSGSFDAVSNAERIEFRISTMDDKNGTIKRWFKERAQKVASRDGTFGVPMTYLIKLKVMHSYVEDGANGAEGAFIDTFVVRPGSIEYDKSRREDGLEELQITLVQFDTFTTL